MSGLVAGCANGAHYTTLRPKGIFPNSSLTWALAPPDELWYNRGTMKPNTFWLKLDNLVAACELVVDRPAGSAHPRFPAFAYPLDYGYLAGSRSGDGDGIDVWIGNLPERAVTGIICTVDLLKQDAEVKILLGCTPEEARTALAVHDTEQSSAILVLRRNN